MDTSSQRVAVPFHECRRGPGGPVWPVDPGAPRAPLRAGHPVGPCGRLNAERRFPASKSGGRPLGGRSGSWDGGPMLSSRTSRVALLTLVAAAGAAASSVPVASAATQRYASPAGAGSKCSPTEPCDIAQAIWGAGTGDEVIVNPGDYPLTATLTEGNQITIHGVAGQPRPRLLFSGPGQNGLRLYHGSTLRYVEVDQAAGDNGQNALAAFEGAMVDQVIAKAPVQAVYVRDSTVSNSIAVASGTNGRAVFTAAGGAGDHTTSAFRNVTAIATGSGGVPIEAYAGTTGSATVHLVNVIAYSGPGGLSLRASTDNSGAQATITATHTNYQSADTVGSLAALVDGGGNRAEEPAFVNAAAGDYRQAPGAYTIDAGLNDPMNGAFDVDGDPRVIGTTDIGADEFVGAPTATTASAGAVTDTTASPTTQAPPATPPTQAFAGVRLVSSRLAFARGLVTVMLRCPAGTVGRCSGRTKLTVRQRRSGSRAASTVILGRAPFSIAAGKQGTVKVRVSRAGRRLLSGARRLRGKDTNAARSGAGQSKTTVAAVTIRRRHS